MPPIIPISWQFAQPTMHHLLAADAVVHSYRTLFDLFEWSAIDPPRKRGSGTSGHPKSAYLKAPLVRISEYLLTTPPRRAHLLELGFPSAP